jgi:hypothetical protein
MSIEEALDYARQASQTAEEKASAAWSEEAARRWDLLAQVAHGLANSWRDKAKHRKERGVSAT